jgi:hypothetical protein
MEANLPTLQVDLRGVSYEDWLAFIFDHPVARVGEKEWYFQADLELQADPARQVAFLARLFRAPEALDERFPPGQVEQGFWFMFGYSGAEQWFRAPLWDASVPWEDRRACLRALPELYARLFERCPLDTAPYMLPDLLAYDYGPGGRRPDGSEEDRRVRAALLDAFREMLASGHPETQRAALHGLHHLAHPDGPGVIRAYLGSEPRPGPELRRYAGEVLAGKAI